MASRINVAPAGPSVSGRPETRRWLALAVLCVSLLIVTLDNTVLNVALPTLVRDLHATTTQLQWIVDSYVIVFAGLLLTAGSVADRVGRKKTFAAGLVAFAAGSTWAAFSGSVGVLIAARASMGIGGAPGRRAGGRSRPPGQVRLCQRDGPRPGHRSRRGAGRSPDRPRHAPRPLRP